VAKGGVRKKERQLAKYLGVTTVWVRNTLVVRRRAEGMGGGGIKKSDKNTLDGPLKAANSRGKRNEIGHSKVWYYGRKCEHSLHLEGNRGKKAEGRGKVLMPSDQVPFRRDLP